MIQISIENAEKHLGQLIYLAGEGEEIILTDADQPTARIVSLRTHERIAKSNRVAGSGKGLFSLSPDFDDPLDEMKEYME